MLTERATVQNPILRYAQEVGWHYLAPEDALALRGGEEQPILRRVFVEKLQLLNPNAIDSVQTAEEVLERLIRIPANIEGNLQAWEYLRGLKTVFVHAERRERNLRLLDLENPTANALHVTDEFRFRSGAVRIRADVVFCVNGIPVLLIETKAASRIEGIAEALDQVRRYHEQAPDLMVHAQLAALTHLVQFFYGPTWALSRKTLLNWRDECAGGDFETLVKSFIAPSRLLRVLTEYIIFPRRDGELTKVVLRPHQIRAAERVVGRVRDPQKRRGLVWHTQGSGKTYTMITVARLLLEDPRLQNPTVLMIVDRNELQQQLFQNLESVGFGHVEVARSKKHLYDLLRRDTRGLIVSMIHKFDDMPADLNPRANIIVLIDEAHRTTGGDLGNYLMGALPNATFIGFTGTPIDKTKHGKGTFKIFGADDERGYLDKYSIAESIQDGTTVPLHYQLAPNNLLADREAMEREFWQLAELEGVADVEELNRVLERAVTLTNMLKNRDRVDKIAQFVAGHFQKYVQPSGYKAFLVAVDREACVFYKEALDKYLPPDWSAVVISPAHNDPAHLRQHHLSEEQERQIRVNFRKPDTPPHILIVTEKLLTGYDAPILYCMYMDKPMRDHVLLQAIARVNRPYESDSGQRKTTGLIVDFVAVFENLERALAFDSQEVSGVIEGLEVLQKRFEQLMAHGRHEYLEIGAGLSGDKQLEAYLHALRDRAQREEFYRYIRELQEIYEILSPDAFLRPFLEDYQQLLAIYRALREAYEPHIDVDRSFLRKTAELVQRHSHTDLIREPSATYELGATALQALLREDRPTTVKVFNLLKQIHALVMAQGEQSPYLVPIGERAEQIRKRFEEAQLQAEQALEELENLTEQLCRAQQEQRNSPLDPAVYAVMVELRLQGYEAAQAYCLVEQLQALLQEYPHWAARKDHERALRIQLYVAIRDCLGTDEVVALAQRVLELLRRATNA
ncbi:MAG: HsdR family type I site-specific deoxyribonuclease [Fimbriimonadales bacterium]|nr:HsdR family type I site-specific deoxyribonuclease [Fimbriimonadales bacterium]